MILITIALFLSSSLLRASDSCQNYYVKIIFNKKEVITKEVICSHLTSDNMLFYLSKSCLKDQCDVLKQKKKPIEIPNYLANFGSPGFKLCQELGGLPQIYEFSVDQKNWESTERCLFGKNDFVEISLLSKGWKSFIKVTK